jgi:hypothetical protein
LIGISLSRARQVWQLITSEREEFCLIIFTY